MDKMPVAEKCQAESRLHLQSGCECCRQTPYMNMPKYRLTDANLRSWSKAALATMGRILGIDRCTLTTPRASARTTRQTSHILGAFGRMEGAHPSMLFNLLWCNLISLSGRIPGDWLPHTARRRRASPNGRAWAHIAIRPIWWRGPPVVPCHLWAVRIAR